MKKILLLSLSLALLGIWAFAGADNSDPVLTSKPTDQIHQQRISQDVQVHKTIKHRSDIIRLNAESGVQVKRYKTRMEALKADGVISADELDEYRAILAEYQGSPLPQPLNQVSESEPNEDCQSADPVACGDTVWCATINGTDDVLDYFVFTLDDTYDYWEVTIETHAGDDCSDPTDPVGDTQLTLYNSDCTTELDYNDDGGDGLYSLIVKNGLEANEAYVAMVNAYGTNTGDYHISFLCAEGTGPPPNDNCVGVIDLGSGLPVSQAGTTTDANDDLSTFPSQPPTWQDTWYTSSCAGPDVYYKYTAPQTGFYNFDVCDTDWDSDLTLWDYTCPTEPVYPDDFITGADNQCDGPGSIYAAKLVCVPLTQGQEVLVVVDGYSTASGNFTLNITDCPAVPGACCIDLVCELTTDEQTCLGMGGYWYEGEECPGFECPVPPMECPANTLYDQNPSEGSWVGVSDLEWPIIRFDDVSVSGSVTDVHFWGLRMTIEGSAPVECFEDPMPFMFELYPDDGTGYPDFAGGPYCVYDLGPLTGTNTGENFGGYGDIYRYEAVLDEPCTFNGGWIAIYAYPDDPPTECYFWWHSHGLDDGTGFSREYFPDTQEWDVWDQDCAFCLTGEYIPTYGACCDDATGICNDGVEILDCPEPLRFAALPTTCATLDPPCGVGACCDDVGDCYITTEVLCTDAGHEFIGLGTVCDPNPCPADFEGAEPFLQSFRTFTSYEVGDPAGWQYLPADGNPAGCAFHNDDNVDTGCDDWLISNGDYTVPSDPGVVYFSWDQKTYFCEYYLDVHEVLVSTDYEDGNDPSGYTWATLWSEGDCTEEDVWGNKEVDISAYAGQDVHFAFHYLGDYADRWWVDNVLVYVDPFGACCHMDLASACTDGIVLDDCVLLGGLFFEGQTCAETVCPFNPCYQPTVIYSNGMPNDESGLTCDRRTNGSLDSWCVDDVLFEAETHITDLHWWAMIDSVEGYEFDWQGTDDYIILADDAGAPGAVLYEVWNIANYRIRTGRIIQGSRPRPEYIFCIEGLDITLQAGTYWFGMRPVNQAASGQCFIQTAEIIGSQIYFKSESFGFPDWVPGTDIFGDPYGIAFCITDGPAITGSCCDDDDGTCDDGITGVNCPEPLRWTPGVLCDDLIPPCGEIDPVIDVTPTEVTGEGVEFTGPPDTEVLTVSNIGYATLEWTAAPLQLPGGSVAANRGTIKTINTEARPLTNNGTTLPERDMLYNNRTIDNPPKLSYELGKPIEIVENRTPLNATEYCAVVMDGPILGVYGGFIYGQESYAFFQDPDLTCTLSPTYPFMVTGMGFCVQNTSGATVPLDFSIAIYEADVSTPSCPVISTLVWQSSTFSTSLETGFYYTWSGLGVDAVVNGPYFMVVNFENDVSATALDFMVGSSAITACWMYLDYGSGWEDLSGYVAYSYPEQWYTEGYTAAPGCEVVCTGDPEGEDCGLDLNGGCNSDPPAFGAIACGQTICGTAYADAGTRDTDWLNFELTEQMYVFVSVETEFPGILQVVDATDCGNVTGWQMYVLPCDPSAMALVLDPGIWTVVVLADAFYGIPCDETGFFGIDYELSLSCQPIWLTVDTESGSCPPDVPLTVSMDATNLAEGIYEGAIVFESNDPVTPILSVPVTFDVTSGVTDYLYLPGDTQMPNPGMSWPPSLLGADVTYLVNYYSNASSHGACLMYNADAPGTVPIPYYLFASADVNGDCKNIGGDVTWLVNYFAGTFGPPSEVDVGYCTFFVPAWPTPDDVPATRPTGWPTDFCVPPPVNSTVIPTGSSK
jgi:hypothetical protein